MAFVNEKVPQCWQAPGACGFTLLGELCGGVLMEHSLGTDGFLSLNWSNFMASPSLAFSSMKVLNCSEAPPSFQLVGVVVEATES